MVSDYQTGKHGFEVELKKAPPVEIAGLIGDAVHNLRASLDHLISACARARGERIDNTYFPFAKIPAEIERRIADRAGAAGKVAMDFCRESKPYKGGNDVLYGLSRSRPHGQIPRPHRLGCGGRFSLPPSAKQPQ